MVRYAATPPPVAIAAPAPPPVQAAPVTAAVACSNYSTVMGEAGFPKEAIRAGIEKGDALVQFTLTAAGEVKDAVLLRVLHRLDRVACLSRLRDPDHERVLVDHRVAIDPLARDVRLAGLVGRDVARPVRQRAFPV